IMMSYEYLVECNIDDDDVKKVHPVSASSPQFFSTSSLTQGEVRDPCGLNKHLKVNAARCFGGARVWVYSGVGFECARLWGYRSLTALCALPLSCLRRGLFALLACMHIWYAHFGDHLCVSQLACVRSLWMSVVNIFITPLCTSVARCCSGIHVVFSKE
uniref:Caveolin n=1 Tax=Cyprinus carpio TaxID=7962 RepID=A0A8C2I2B7_CYPCA